MVYIGIFDVFKKKQKEDATFAQMLNGFSPIFSQFGHDIYASDVVQQAISCITQEMKKLNPQHIRKGNNSIDTISVNDSSVQRILNNPNPIMTQNELLEKIIWQLFFNYNSFVIPTYEDTSNRDGTINRRYTGLWPVRPTQVDFLESGGEIYIKMRFSNNFETTLLYADVIHIKYKFSVNEFMGGNQQGQPDNESLLKTLELNDVLLQGISKAMKSSFAINGIVKHNTLLDKGKTAAAIKELEDHLRNNEHGFLPLDINGEFIPFTRQIELVDDLTLKFIDEKILRNYGVSIAILTGDYTKAQYEAFYQKVLEPLIISLGQAFTKTLFTDREKGFGNEVRFFSEELIFMTNAEKLELLSSFGASGGLYQNEVRVMFGMRPLPELEGVRMQSLNWINVDMAKEYQMKGNNGGSNNE